MKHLGDITKISGYEVPVVDVVVGGSPCQDLSVAGLRAGLDGDRSGLFREQIRVIKEMRENDRLQNAGRTDESVRRPRYGLWENVAGAFSSNGGEDFREVLESFLKIADPQVSVPGPDKGKWANAGCIIGDHYSLAWRTLDAQWWGVPQRRRRIALLCDFNGQSAPYILFGEGKRDRETDRGAGDASCGCTGDGCRSEVQPLSDCLQGNHPQSGTQRQGTSCSAEKGSSLYDRAGETVAIEGNGQRPSHRGDGYAVSDKSFTLNTTEVHGVAFSMQALGDYKESDVASAMKQRDFKDATDLVVTMGHDERNAQFNESGIVDPLTASDYKQPTVVAYGYRGDGDVAGDHAYALTGDHDNRPTDLTNIVVYRKQAHPMNAEDPQTWEIADVNDTLNAFDNSENRTPTVVVMDRAAYNKGFDSRQNYFAEETDFVPPIMASGVPAVAYTAQDREGKEGGGKGILVQKDRASTLATSNHQYLFQPVAVDVRNCSESDVNCALQSTSCHNLNSNNVVRVRYIVRRLTPRECERLQGFPDNWTYIGEWTDSKGRRKQTSDSSRYRALGNSIALPQWAWIMKRISAQYERSATLASLFDGIAGFPLCWERINGKGSCLWASEVEEFCIAVTKKHFPEEETDEPDRTD